MQQLGLLNFSQQINTDYGPVTVASPAKNSDDAGVFPITILWPADSKIGVIHGQWQRLESGEIEAVYNDAAELRESLRFAAYLRGIDL